MTLLAVLFATARSVGGYFSRINKTVAWYEAVVEPAIEAQRARERQVLASAAEQQARAQQQPPSPTPTEKPPPQ